MAGEGAPGGGGDFFLHFAVISALGVAMIFWALLIELPSIVILAVSVAAAALSYWMIPPAGEIATLWPYWKLLLFVPSHRDAVNVMYPFVPWPSFLAVTLGVNLLLIGVFALTPKAKLGFLEVFGRSPLFFYLLHLHVLAALSFAFPNGSSLPVMYAVWAAVLVATYPLVAAFGRFKASKPVESLWRML